MVSTPNFSFSRQNKYRPAGALSVCRANSLQTESGRTFCGSGAAIISGLQKLAVRVYCADDKPRRALQGGVCFILSRSARAGAHWAPCWKAKRRFRLVLLRLPSHKIARLLENELCCSVRSYSSDGFDVGKLAARTRSIKINGPAR